MGYVSSVVQLVRQLSQWGFDSEFVTCSMSDLELSRNLLASQALASDATHLLFIDADMSFRSGLIKRMIDFNEPFVSTVYPKREIDLAKLLGNVTQEDLDNPGGWSDFISRNLKYVLRQNGLGESFEGRAGFARVLGTGMGICLLQRSVLEQLIDVGKAARLMQTGKDFGFPSEFAVYGFFDRVRDATGTRLSEDYSFCARWTTRCKGDIWACIDEPIGHVGSFEFKGTFARTLSPPERGS